MNKRNLFRKAGKITSVAAGLSSALLPSLAVEADGFVVNKNKKLNDAFSNSWLSYVYYIFRFGFLKNYIVNKLAKKLVEENVKKIEELTKEKGEAFEFNIGDRTVAVYNFIFDTDRSYEKPYTVSIGVGDFECGGCFSKSVSFGRAEYEESEKALRLFEKTTLCRDFFNFLIKQFEKPSFVKEGYVLFAFKSPIDLGDMGKCTSLAFLLSGDSPEIQFICRSKDCLGKKDSNIFGGNVVNYFCDGKEPMPIEKIKDILKTIKEQIKEDKVELKVCDKNNMEEFWKSINSN